MNYTQLYKAANLYKTQSAKNSEDKALQFYSNKMTGASDPKDRSYAFNRRKHILQQRDKRKAQQYAAFQDELNRQQLQKQRYYANQQQSQKAYDTQQAAQEEQQKQIAAQQQAAQEEQQKQIAAQQQTIQQQKMLQEQRELQGKQQRKNNLKTLGLTSGGALAGAGIAGGITSLLTNSKKARIIAALLGGVGGGVGGYALANRFNKSASLRKVASNEQIYKVAKLMKRACQKNYQRQMFQ